MTTTTMERQLIRRQRRQSHLYCAALALITGASSLLSPSCVLANPWSHQRNLDGSRKCSSRTTTTAFQTCLKISATRQIRRVEDIFGVFSAFQPVARSELSFNRRGYKRPRDITRLHLLAGVNRQPNDNRNSDNDDEDDAHDQEEDEIDFPTWVRALRRWPLMAVAPSEEELAAMTFEEKDEIMTKKAAVPATLRAPPTLEGDQPVDLIEAVRNDAIPLASLLNVEALLVASGEETMENSTDLKYMESASHMSSAVSKSCTNATDVVGQSRSSKNATTPLSILPRLEELGRWDQLVGSMQRSLSDIPSLNKAAIGNTTDFVLREATSRLEYLVGEASKISPTAVQDLLVRASRAVASKDAKGESAAANDLVKVAEQMAREQGLDVKEASAQARAATKYTANLVTLANGLLTAGFVAGEQDTTRKQDARPLFSNFKSAKAVTRSKFKTAVAKAAEMGSLAGAIYQETIPRTLGLGHAIVANGTSDDVAWLVTDSLMYQDEFQETLSYREKRERKPLFVRTITLRGFDASDEDVDRELLLNRICTATPERLNDENGVLLHSGLLEIARAIYKDVENYIDLTPPSHRLVINGHSVGGSLSILLLLLLTEKRGADYVRDKVLRVFTFGSPPVAVCSRKSLLLEADAGEESNIWDGPVFGASSGETYGCSILEAFGLPPSIVYGYIQPWDPIVRLFTEIDPLYPLIGDVGEDGVTPYASGPPRSLRTITRAIIESWEGWPRFRDTFKNTVNQNYTCVGVQHILLPEPIRYLTDRLVSVNVGVPPVDGMLRISSQELLSSLEATFPLDTFSISFVPAAIRSFVHHFYPAYGFPIVDFAAKRFSQSSIVSKEVNDMEKEDYQRAMGDLEERFRDVSDKEQPSSKRSKSNNKEGGGGIGWAPPWQYRMID